MKTKICTDTEQSKHLLELGLDSETADMVILHEEPYETSDSKFDGVHQVLCVSFKEYDKSFRQKYRNISYFPAWSLSALFELMPEYLNGYSLSIRKIDSSYCCVYSDYHGEDYVWYNGKTPLDAAYSMVVYLLKQKPINSDKV